MRTLSATALGVVLLLAAPVARAEESPTQALAKKHYETGKSYYEIANYKEALEEFEKAFKLQPLPALLYNIGRCHESLGNLKAAIASYREYLAKQKESADRAVIEARIANLEKRLAAEQPARPPEPKPPAEGKPPAESKPDETRPPSDEPVATGPRWRRPTGWALLGVGVASLAVGIASGALVKKKNDEYSEGAAASGTKTYAELEQIADAGRRWQSIEIATLVVGGVLAAAGSGLLIWDATSRGKRQERALSLHPFVSATGFGLAGSTRF